MKAKKGTHCGKHDLLERELPKTSNFTYITHVCIECCVSLRVCVLLVPFLSFSIHQWNRDIIFLCPVNLMIVNISSGDKKIPRSSAILHRGCIADKQNTIYVVPVAFEGMAPGISYCNKIENSLCRSFPDCTLQYHEARYFVLPKFIVVSL